MSLSGLNRSRSVQGHPLTDRDHSIIMFCKVILVFINESPAFTTEKAMATHSSTLAWKIPWTEESGGLPSRGSHRVGHD